MVMDILTLSECKACYVVVNYTHDGWNIMFLGFDSVYDDWCIHDCIYIMCLLVLYMPDGC